MIYETSAYATIQKAIDAAIAAGGSVVHVLPGTYRENVTLGNRVTLMGEPGLSILKSVDFSGLDVITALNCTGARVVGMTVDGNQGKQAGRGLLGDDLTAKGRGIFFSGCTDSEIINCRVSACQMHGALIYGGTDNRVENLQSNANGSTPNLNYANGLMIWDSPRCRVRDFIGNDNPENSGLSVRGALGVNVDLSGISCEGNGASNITLNSPYCRLSGFYSAGATGSMGNGLAVGHNDDPDLYADYAVIAGGQVVGNAIAGIAVGACIGGRFSDIVSRANAKHNLLVSCTDVSKAYRARELGFANNIFDTTTEAGDIPIGDGILLTSLEKVDAAIGDYFFTNCQSINALRYGLRVAGASRVRWVGGSLKGNGSGTYVTSTNGQVVTDVEASAYVQ